MIITIKNRRDFLACAASGNKFVRPTVVVQARLRTLEDAAFVPPEQMRVGFTCTKTLGNAVVRNRIKRRLRAVAAKVFSEHGKKGHDYVIIGRSKAERCDFAEITADLTMSVTRLTRIVSKNATVTEVPPPVL